MKTKRKLWVMIFGKYKFDDIVFSLCPERNIEVLVAFKPDMHVHLHLGVKGTKEDIDDLKRILNENGNTTVSRKPTYAFPISFERQKEKPRNETQTLD